jgi:hypothetical protein
MTERPAEMATSTVPGPWEGYLLKKTHK